MNSFNYPGQEHLPRAAATPAPTPASMPAKQPPHTPDVQRRALSVELAIKGAGPGTSARLSPVGVEMLLHAAYSIERYLVTGVPAYVDGEAPANNGATAVNR